MNYHGNYCGPNWSSGKRQPSVNGGVRPVDEFDRSCLIHDQAYALGSNLADADLLFARNNLVVDGKRLLASALVGTQGLLRTLDNYITPPISNQSQMTTSTSKRSKSKKNLRGTQPAPSAKQNTLTTVPAAYGFSLRMKPPTIKRSGNTATIIGGDYAGSVYASNTSLYEPAASVLLNPIFFNNAMLGNLARVYEKFRFTKAVIQYIPSVPTSTQGQVIMTSTRTVKEPFINSSSTTFLSRALSQGNAVACPVWKEETIDLPRSDDWHVVDALIDGDLDDSIQEEVQVYATCESTLTVGILVLHYEIEFKDPLFVYHPTVIPNPVGNGSIVTMQDSTIINAITDTFDLTTFSTPLSAMGSGAIYRCVFIQARSILPGGGATWSTLARIAHENATTSTTENITYTNLILSSGTVFYGLQTGGYMTFYASYEAASAGGQHECVFYQTATSVSVGTYSFLISGIKLGPSLRITTQ